MRWSQLFLDVLIMGGDMANCVSYASILLHLQKKRSCEGISLQSLLCLAMTRVQHIFSHNLSLHYQPTTMPGFVYSGCDFISMCLGLLSVALIFGKYRATYDADKDDFGEVLIAKLLPKAEKEKTRTLKWVVLYAMAILGSCVWFRIRRTTSDFMTGMFCCFYEVITSVALLPQLWMFHKEKVVSQMLANFVVFVAVNRLCIFSFWAFYPWVFYGRHPDNRGIQMASEALNLLILGDFLFYYIRAKLTKGGTSANGDILLDTV
jgi:hypothetical protein